MEKNINILPIELLKFKDKISQKKCFYSACESTKIIKAHSIQENGPLAFIADKIGTETEVYYLDDEFGFDQSSQTMVSKQKIQRVLHHRGIAVASTFGGFCEEHDKIFKNTIEDVDFIRSENQLFYHTYRSYAYFMHKQYEFLKLITTIPNELNPKLNSSDLDKRLIDKDDNELIKSLNNLLDGVQNLVNGTKSIFISLAVQSEKSLVDFKLKKNRLDEIVVEKRFDKMDYFLMECDGLFPVVSSTVLQYIDDSFPQHPNSDGVICATEFALSVFPNPKKSKTYVILGSFPENPNWKILCHKLNIMTNSDKFKFISDLLLSRGNNIYLSPRMINKMSEKEIGNLISIRVDEVDCPIGVPLIEFNLFDIRFKE